MKKTLVAIAALAAVGAASAQSSVTLYGRIDASIGNVKTTTAGVTVADPGVMIRSGGHTGSRWGLRGSEDLGGGLKANFTLEQGFNIDDGTASSARQFHRQAFVGLSGGFGSLNVGRQYDITDNMYGLYDPTGYSGYSAMGYAFNVGCGTGGSGDCVGRQDNSVMYTTPSMGGFSVAAMWAPGEDKTAAAGAGRMYGIMANYAMAPSLLAWAGSRTRPPVAVPAPTPTSARRTPWALPSCSCNWKAARTTTPSAPARTTAGVWARLSRWALPA